jgi:hypothetical protein
MGIPDEAAGIGGLGGGFGVKTREKWRPCHLLDLFKKVRSKLAIGCEQNGNIHALPALTQI